MKRILLLALASVLCGGAGAKLPPPTEEAKAKAAETAGRTAHGNKVAEYQLCKSMDKVAVKYIADAKKAGKDVTPTATPPCTDPGQFNTPAPSAKPLEAAGAHSPPATAATPPSSNTPAAATAPAKK